MGAWGTLPGVADADQIETSEKHLDRHMNREGSGRIIDHVQVDVQFKLAS